MFVFLSRHIMPPKKFTATPEIFRDPDGPYSLAMADKTGICYVGSPDDSNYLPLVVSESPPALSEVRTMFIH